MSTRRPVLLSALPSIADFAWLLPVLFLFGRMNGARTLLGDGDTGWHIRTGEWILAHHQVPHEDIFSFTAQGRPWFAWEWLSDVAMGWLHRTGGMQAVLLASIVLICCVFGLLYQLIRRKSGSVLIAFTLTAIAAGGSSIHWLARPHLFTMLFLVGFYSILERNRTRLLLVLPVAEVLWTNLHGGFLTGIVLIAAYSCGEALAALAAPDSRRRLAAAGRSLRYALLALACLAASFINPYTWHLHQHLLQFFSNPAYFQTISEFTSISFRHPLAPFFEAMLVLGMATAFWNALRKRFITVVLLGGWAHLALLSMRNIPLFMIIAAPAVGRALAEWLVRLRSAPDDSILKRFFCLLDSLSVRLNTADTRSRWHVAGPLVVVAIGFALYAPNPSLLFQADYDHALYPVAAMPSLRASDRIFSSDTWGGYLIFKRYPAKVFIDGRSDFFGPEFEAQYSAIIGVRYDWEALLACSKVDTVLIPANSPLTAALKLSRNWHAVFDDGRAIVFRLTPGL